MAIDFPAFQKHLDAFDFNALFVDVLGWMHPAQNVRDWRNDETRSLARYHKSRPQLVV